MMVQTTVWLKRYVALVEFSILWNICFSLLILIDGYFPFVINQMFSWRNMSKIPTLILRQRIYHSPTPGYVTRYLLRVPKNLAIYKWLFVHICYETSMKQNIHFWYSTRKKYEKTTLKYELSTAPICMLLLEIHNDQPLYTLPVISFVGREHHYRNMFATC